MHITRDMKKKQTKSISGVHAKLSGIWKGYNEEPEEVRLLSHIDSAIVLTCNFLVRGANLD